MNEGLRWDPGYLAKGPAFSTLWRALSAQAKHRVMFVCGAGFDPRAPVALRGIVSAGAMIDTCVIIDYSSGVGLGSASDRERAGKNIRTIQDLAQGGVEPIKIAMRSSDGRSTGSVAISSAFNDPERYSNFSDVVIDITALPTELYFPLIATLTRVWSSHYNGKDGPNLHTVVCDNPGVDMMISGEGGDKAESMYGFPGNLHRASIDSAIPIWVPILGEGQQMKIEKIAEYVGARFVVPVFPFPAQNPRRGDDLFVEYRDLVRNSSSMDLRDIIYADEQDPFDLYRKICHLTDEWKATLQSIGTPQIVVSPHSGKLHSVGALLSALDRDLAIAHVQPTGHVVSGEFSADHYEGELFEIWLAGAAYE